MVKEEKAMKKRAMVMGGILVVLLTACGGNKLDLDLEKVQEMTAKEALNKKSIERDDYEEENIEIVKVCEAVKVGEEDYGFDGQYLVYWQTDDGEFKNDFVMQGDYDIGYGTQRLVEIEDRCLDVN